MSEPLMDTQEAEARGWITWAVARCPGPGKVVMTSAFGLSGVVLIHLVAAVAPMIPIVFVDTGQMFQEVLDLRDRINERYDVRIVTVTVEGAGLPLPKELDCCEKRKVEPMQKALAEFEPEILLTARGRFQTVTRRHLDYVEWDRDPKRVNPLVNWAQTDIEWFVREHHVPYNPLYDQGYRSIGCLPCTRAIKIGEDARAGRWDGLGKIECGLWE